MAEPQITIDLKPQLTVEALRGRLANSTGPNEWLRVLKLSASATVLLESYFPEELADAEQLIARLKSFPLHLTSPRPIAEAISSAGGVRWHELDEKLMVRKLPGVFLAGEMIDWEAPTGGYLLQGCFATGTRAGRGAADWARADS
jgi:predicted flavoprotein YhiN